MGIPGIYKQIGPGERVALSKLAVEHLEDTGRPLRIAIDISIWQFQIQSGQGGKNPALRTLYYRLLRLLALSIQPLFIFDGPHRPSFKRGKKVAPGAACLPDFLTKELLKRFGFPYHIAPGEAEAECALFQKEGLVDAVLSEDVDTLMFGCGMTLRNWTAEGARGNKSPTHVNVYKAETTKEAAGLDREGMILVALMSGGDYITAGMPGCGPKTACEAAKAGFGHDLCRIPNGDVARLQEWRDRLGHELSTNESKHFRQKHKTLKIPENFPNMTVLGYYTQPTVSSKEKVSELRNEISWSSEIKVSELRSFVEDAFNWSYIGAKKFIRGLAPALLARRLVGRNASHGGNEDDVEAKELAEAGIVKAVCDRRCHWNTDGTPELRIAYVPSDIVRIDWAAEEEEDFEAYNASDDDQPASGGDDTGDPSMSPIKKRGPSSYDPTEVEKIWMLETYVKLGVPLLVESWEEDMRNPKKFASRKARVAKTLSKTRSKAGTKPGAMDGYFKVTKANVNRAPKEADLDKQSDIDRFSPILPAPASASSLPSPQKKPSSENPRPTKQTIKRLDDKAPKERQSRSKTMTAAPQKSSPPSTKNKASAVNPWTLSKRPPDTTNFRSPTRYSALGIYAPNDPESLETPSNRTSVSDKDQERPLSPPSSPTPRKRRSQPTTPISSPNSTKPSTSTPKTKAFNTPHTTKTTNPNAAGLLTPSTQHRDHTKPSPRKKRSPLHQTNEPYLSEQLRTPTSIRKETLLDTFIEKGNAGATLTAKKVNRKLVFTDEAQAASPASDCDSLPSPSTFLFPRALRDRGKEACSEDEDTCSQAKPKPLVEWPDSRFLLGKEGRGGRLVMLRESLEGAWKCLEPWEGRGRGVWSGVEVVDLTGA